LVMELEATSMARPRSEDKRNAIIEAATRVIGTHGLSAPTAMIAKEAGVSNGSLFAYFETKADLLNRLYVGLKAEMAEVALDGLATESDIRTQMFHMWSHLLRWAISCPEKRRTLAHLSVSRDITSETRQNANDELAGVIQLVERGRENGPMRDAPLGFVAALMTALLDATSDYMIQDPANADKHCMAAFDAFWRMIA
jgi:AcrR family transcriptional regulator